MGANVNVVFAVAEFSILGTDMNAMYPRNI